MRTASLGIRIQPQVKAALEKAAALDHRTVASYVELLIIKDLQEKKTLQDAFSNMSEAAKNYQGLK